MSDSEHIAAVREILDRKRAVDTCNCTNCRNAIAVQGVTTCEDCGYHGLFVAAACACYDDFCPGGQHGRGAGCFHGGIFCPVCDGKENVDPWEIIREVRAALAKARGETTP